MRVSLFNQIFLEIIVKIIMLSLTCTKNFQKKQPLKVFHILNSLHLLLLLQTSTQFKGRQGSYMQNYGFNALPSFEVKLDFCLCCSTWIETLVRVLLIFFCFYGKTGMKFMSPSSHIVLDTLPQVGSCIAPKFNYVTIGVVMLPPAVTQLEVVKKNSVLSQQAILQLCTQLPSL